MRASPDAFIATLPFHPASYISSKMSAPPQYTDEPQPVQSSTSKKYGATSSAEDAISSQPLLAHSTGRNAWMDQPSSDDLPDDFKVGVNVIDCDAEIRVAFIRKVYTVLFIQILTTSIVATLMSTQPAIEFTHNNTWIMWIPMLGSFVALLGVYWKRHQHPVNLVMLGLFTLLEAWMIGTITSYYESRIVCLSPLISPYILPVLKFRYFKHCLSPSASSLDSHCSLSRPK